MCLIHYIVVLHLVFLGNKWYLVKICPHYCCVSIKGNTCKGTPNPFPFFPTSPSLSVHSGTLPESLESRPEFPEPPETVRSFRNPRRPSGVSELHPIPFGLASPHFEAHHCTVP